MADLTREEQFLSGIAEGSTVELKPITRREQYLAKIAGQDVEVPDPITREEMLLKRIADGGGGGGGYGAVVRTYTGTIASIVSANNIDSAGLASAFLSNGATSYLEFDYQEYTGLKIYLQYAVESGRDRRLYYVGNYDSGVYFEVMYLPSSTEAYAYINGAEGVKIPDETPCTLTIIDHPLSSSITAEALSVTANSEYDAPLGKLYNHVSVEVPQNGATINVLGPFDVGDVINAAAISALRMASSGHTKATCLVKAADYYYRVYADFDTTPFEGTVVCWYMDRTNNLLIKKNIVYSDQRVTVNELGSPFEVIRIAGIQA